MIEGVVRNARSPAQQTSLLPRPPPPPGSEEHRTVPSEAVPADPWTKAEAKKASAAAAPTVPEEAAGQCEMLQDVEWLFRVLKHKTHLAKASRDTIGFFISKPGRVPSSPVVCWLDPLLQPCKSSETRFPDALFQQVVKVYDFPSSVTNGPGPPLAL